MTPGTKRLHCSVSASHFSSVRGTAGSGRTVEDLEVEAAGHFTRILCAKGAWLLVDFGRIPGGIRGCRGYSSLDACSVKSYRRQKSAGTEQAPPHQLHFLCLVSR